MIEKELQIKLDQRVAEINALFPQEKISVEILINKIIVKYFEKKVDDRKTTNSIEWVSFRRKNAKKNVESG